MNIIILHGWGQSKGNWINISDKLGKNVQSIDLPGFGTEAVINDNWGVPEYADWVEQKMKPKSEVILIGHSFGGRIAAEIAGRRQTWLKGIVLIGAPCLYRPTYVTQLKIFLFKTVKFLFPLSLRSFLYSNELKAAKESGLEKIFRKVVSYDQTSQIKNIDIPALLIWGDQDKKVPVDIAQEMLKLIPKSELKVIENAGHDVYLEKPELVFAYIKRFITHIS
jgi:pimeloyl-ACP methyl ester carboxylesterase